MIALTNWNLTLPTGKSGHPDVIATQNLPTYSSEYFVVNPDGSINFWCPVTGVTTGGSSYPRTELRETNPDGSLKNWHYTDGDRSLSATLHVTQLPSTGKVVVGQIHDDGVPKVKVGDQPLIKLQYGPSNKIELLYRVKPTDSDSKNFTFPSTIPLGTSFSYIISLTKAGVLSVIVNGVVKVLETVNHAWAAQGLYFKAGAYCQDNVGTATEGAKVVFSSIVLA